MERVQEEWAEDESMTDEDDPYVKLDGTERPYTFGGEAWIDDGLHFAEYGIDFEKVAISGITPDQMAQLACVMVDHLILCGHRFEIQKTREQDQTERLVKISS